MFRSLISAFLLMLLPQTVLAQRVTSDVATVTIVKLDSIHDCSTARFQLLDGSGEFTLRIRETNKPDLIDGLLVAFSTQARVKANYLTNPGVLCGSSNSSELIWLQLVRP